MKKNTLIPLGAVAILALAFSIFPASAAEETPANVPGWAQKNVDKIAESVPDLKEEQKTKIVDALKTRGEAIKAAGEDKAAKQEAWSAYVRKMKEILNEEQFKKFDEARKKEAGQ